MSDERGSSSLTGSDHSALEDHHVAVALADVRRRVEQAERDFQRVPGSVNLVCVSKTISEKLIRGALTAGQRVFGENRVQEAQAKWPPLKAQCPEIELHLIGSLQSNKVRDAVLLFDVIETVDRVKLAEALANEMIHSGRRPRLLVEINTGDEAQKSGVSPSLADSFLHECKTRLGLEIEGLMCIPPANEPRSPHFALLAKIAQRNGLRKLSMGMSADFELAIQLGATDIRVGSAIFGDRTH